VGVDVAVGEIGIIFFTIAVGIGEDAGGTEVIGVEVAGRATRHLDHGDPLTAREDEFDAGERGRRPFADVEFTDVDGGIRTIALFDAAAIAVVDEGGRHAVFDDAVRPVLEVVGDNSPSPEDHVAVGIVGIGVRPGTGDRMRAHAA